MTFSTIPSVTDLYLVMTAVLEYIMKLSDVLVTDVLVTVVLQYIVIIVLQLLFWSIIVIYTKLFCYDCCISVFSNSYL